MNMEMQQSTRNMQSASPQQLVVEVQVQQTYQPCWSYRWNHEKGRLDVSAMQPAHSELPADLARLFIEQQEEVAVLIFTAQSIAADAWISVRVLGALQVLAPEAASAQDFPLANWLLLAVPDMPQWSSLQSVEDLPADFLRACHSYWRYRMACSSISVQDIVVQPADVVGQKLRQTRGWIKRTQHEQMKPRSRHPFAAPAEEKAVIWHAIEGLSAEQHRQVAQAKTLEELTPFLQAEQIIQFVPARYQQALSQLLLEDERLLAFMHRPVLEQRSGLLSRQRPRFNEGLFLVTDRQVLWLHDFFSPGSSGAMAGYFAHAVPLDRLRSIQLLPSTSVSALRVPVQDTFSAPSSEPVLRVPTQVASPSPYVRLALEIAGRAGSEWFVVAFPDGEASEEALKRITAVLQAFLPRASGQRDRRLCCLSQVDAWQPRGAEAEQLAALGGIVPEEQKQRLEQWLAESMRATEEEVLVVVLVPEMLEYKSPSRLVALTRQAVLLFDYSAAKRLWRSRQPEDGQIMESRYELAEISSAQLSYSLYGSSLRLFVPGQADRVYYKDIPFQGPAIAWFQPLFTRLCQMLNDPRLSYI